MEEALKLWTFHSSPFAGKVRVALREKDVPVELIEIHPARRPARLRELNPLGRVPVLEVDGVALNESAVILEWLEETHPSPALWPAEPEERALARASARWVDEALLANYFGGLRRKTFGVFADEPEDEGDRLLARLGRQWPRLEAALGRRDGPWLMGEAFTYADVGGMPLAVRLPQWTEQLAPDPGEFPLGAAWLQALRQRPSAPAVEERGPERLEA